MWSAASISMSALLLSGLASAGVLPRTNIDLGDGIGGSGCRSLSMIKIDNKPYDVEFIGNGVYGCAYDIINGYKGQPALLKTPKSTKTLEQHEVDNLRQIGELLWTGTGDDKATWMIIVKHPGTRIDKTPKWQQNFGLRKSGKPNWQLSAKDMKDKDKVSKCQNLIERVVEKASARILYYGENYKVWHADYHWGNFLVTNDWGQLYPIDWGRTGPPDELDDIDWTLAFTSQLPLIDYIGKVQGPAIYEGHCGVCYSEHLINGGYCKPPFPDLADDESEDDRQRAISLGIVPQGFDEVVAVL